MTTDALGPLAVDRRAQVLDVLHRRGSARVSELTEELGVTAVTVRRDIARLAEEGLVQRVHGRVTLLRAPEEGEGGVTAPGAAAVPPAPAPAPAPAPDAPARPAGRGRPATVGMLVASRGPPGRTASASCCAAAATSPTTTARTSSA
jgi:DNA-binding transcriptional MocR family regulator